MALAERSREPNDELTELCVNTIRTLCIDAVQKANSGHPGMPMGMAPTAFLLFTRYMRHNPRNPRWYGRDRFVLSAGHGSMLLYSSLYLTGYELTLQDIKRFRQLGSRTPGHPEYGAAPGIETTTGPLGQGFGNGVGMAIAAKHIQATYGAGAPDVFAHRVFGICGDGDLMEGVSSEAASLAGHLRLGNIVYIYDSNRITIDGSTSITFDEDVSARFDAYGWHTQEVADANDLDSLGAAIERAMAETNRPSLIRVHSHIGYGSPHRQDSAEAHGKALGVEEVKLTKKFYRWPIEPDFYVPETALTEFRRCIERGANFESEWNRKFDQWAQSNRELAKQFKAALSGELPAGWDLEIPRFTPQESLASREAAAKAEQAIAKRVPALFGGSADLNESTFTDIKDGGSFAPGSYAGRNVHFGIREHAMCAALNGIALHGGLIPLGSSFMVFTDYGRPSIRLAAMMRLHVIFIFTHDSVGVGEDGPTHQPIEHLSALRAIPNLTVIRPCDANESAEAWRVAMQHRSGPIMMSLSRQKLPTFDRSVVAPASGLARGGYVLTETPGRRLDLILISTGSEVQLALGARPELEKRGYAVRIVSMPSQELFAAQDQGYRDSVLPADIRRRLAIEAAAPMSWHRWVGLDGDIIGMTSFGESGPYQDVMKHFSFTIEEVVERALRLLIK